MEDEQSTPSPSLHISLSLTPGSEATAIQDFLATWASYNANVDAVRRLSVKAEDVHLLRSEWNGSGMPEISVVSLAKLAAMFPWLETLDITGLRCQYNYEEFTEVFGVSVRFLRLDRVHFTRDGLSAFIAEMPRVLALYTRGVGPVEERFVPYEPVDESSITYLHITHCYGYTTALPTLPGLRTIHVDHLTSLDIENLSDQIWRSADTLEILRLQIYDYYYTPKYNVWQDLRLDRCTKLQTLALAFSRKFWADPSVSAERKIGTVLQAVPSGVGLVEIKFPGEGLSAWDVNRVGFGTDWKSVVGSLKTLSPGRIVFSLEGSHRWHEDVLKAIRRYASAANLNVVFATVPQ